MLAPLACFNLLPILAQGLCRPIHFCCLATFLELMMVAIQVHHSTVVEDRHIVAARVGCMPCEDVPLGGSSGGEGFC